MLRLNKRSALGSCTSKTACASSRSAVASAILSLTAAGLTSGSRIRMSVRNVSICAALNSYVAIMLRSLAIVERQFETSSLSLAWMFAAHRVRACDIYHNIWLRHSYHPQAGLATGGSSIAPHL
jgi:hypothetical protein